MALLHAATLSPTKQELVAAWLLTQPWAVGEGPVELVGAYRFDDPEGDVGLETHLVRRAGEVHHVPLSYRAAPLAGAEAALVGTTEHSALGTRWVYDGCADPAYLRMLAAVTLTGVGQAVEVFVDGGARTRAPVVRLSGAGWIDGATRVDGWGPATEQDGWTEVRGDEWVLAIARRPRPAGPDAAPTRLLATWPGQAEPALLATATADAGR